jgi:hypothetical protein
MNNRSPNLQIVNGIGNVDVNSTPSVTFVTPRRYHGIRYLCKAVNYTGGAGLTTAKITGAGNDLLTVTPTLTKGEPTVIAIVAGGAGYNIGDKFKITNDATGTGATFTVSAVGGGGAVTAATYDAGSATASPIEPSTLLTKLDVNVESVSQRNISIDSYLRLYMARGLYPKLGELPIVFTEDERNFLGVNDANAFDLHGGQKFEHFLAISANVVKPGLTATQEWDDRRNYVSRKGNSVPLIDPIRYRETQIDLAVGDNDFDHNKIPIGKMPIQRIWLLGATPGNLSKLIVESDGQKRLEGQVADLNARYEKLGYHMGSPNWLNTNWAASNALKAAFNQPRYFDAAYIPDSDGRPGERLFVKSEFKMFITSAVAQKCRVVLELAPGGYKSK